MSIKQLLFRKYLVLGCALTSALQMIAYGVDTLSGAIAIGSLILSMSANELIDGEFARKIR